MRRVQLLVRGGVMVVTLLVGACRPTAVVVTPQPSTPSVPTAPDLNGPWNVVSGQSVSYNIVVDASMVARYTDSLSAIRPTYDSSSTVTTLSWSNRTATRWNGELTSFATGPRVGPLVPVAGVRFPVTLTYSARTPDGPWVRTAPSESGCSVESVVAGIARDVLTPVPSRVRRDAVWQDSSTVTVCRDSIPLEVTSLRRYRVVEAVAVGDDVHLRIERTTTTRLRGTGRQLGEPVTITGSGTGTMRFTLARTDGFIVMGEGEQTLDLRLQGRRRTQEVRQTTRINVQRAR